MLILILLFIWAATVWSIYSNFSTFYSNFSESENYHKAYYASISALERWELVTKQRSPWYVWSWGFIMWEWTWNYLSWWSDKSLSWFSYLWNNDNQSSVFRTINSKTSRIPAEGNGDVEPMLATGDSKDYNMMWYENSEVFLLYYDTSNNNPYENGLISQNNYFSEWISWIIRLPPKLSSFWLLDTGNTSVGSVSNQPENDAIVDRQIKWTFDTNYPFTIYSTPSIDDNQLVIENKDNVFRENDINNTLIFEFWSSKSPLYHHPYNNNNRGMFANLTYISAAQEFCTSSFAEFFDECPNYSSIQFTWVQLKFSILNLLKTQPWNIYPFLEYYIDFWENSVVPDKYYTINARWDYKDYQVNTIIKKPTVKDTVLSSFTSIFN